MKYASRKYIDLIQAASSKWANWDPPHPIKVGDYGTVDKDTDEKIVISSETEQKRDLNLSPQVSIPGIAEASIKGQWKFKSGKTGALLVMAQPRSSWVPANPLFKKLLEIPALKDKYLVMEIVACHAYSMYLSNKLEDTVSLALLAKTPIPVAPLVSASGELGGSWWSETGAGVFRHGCVPPGTYSFTPLFALKRIRKPGFLSRGAAPGRHHVLLANAARCSWEDAEKPWWPLDEDGEEETFKDTVRGTAVLAHLRDFRQSH
ncbi:hypothetical protein B0H14DRAFT_2671480 [Mycena olivaceomarginata]|nr:hypothetical protein B0H14DRAFT_2671480 [Mycena olivaceomarginata]